MRALLLIPRLSDSIHYRPYLESVGAAPVLRWWAERFTARHHGVELTVVCATERQEFGAGAERCPRRSTDSRREWGAAGARS